MKNLMVVCGDSFNYGIGCVNLHTQPYGVLTSEFFNWDLIRLARGSASNYTIYLQGKFAAEMQRKPHLVILGTTSTDRIEWLATGEKLHKPPSLTDVNYHLYPPHHQAPPCHDAPMDFHISNNPQYSPKILSEQVVAFDEYIAARKNSLPNLGYYERLHTESVRKIELINQHYFEITNSFIKRDYDNGVIMLAYRELKKKGINCIIASNDTAFFRHAVDEERDYFNPDWLKCIATWPDSVGSMHTGEDGHADVANRLIKHIQDESFV